MLTISYIYILSKLGTVWPNNRIWLTANTQHYEKNTRKKLPSYWQFDKILLPFKMSCAWKNLIEITWSTRLLRLISLMVMFTSILASECRTADEALGKQRWPASSNSPFFIIDIYHDLFGLGDARVQVLSTPPWTYFPFILKCNTLNSKEY